MNRMKQLKTLAIVALAAAAALSCSSELTSNAAPVELIVTHTQNLTLLDLDPSINDPVCDQSIGTIRMLVIPKSPEATGDFVQVRINRYRVSYRRTDGGTLVPSPIVRPIDTLISVGGSEDAQFTVFELSAFSQAPFAALLPHNGGRDPETGLATVKMNVTVEVFGETLGGDNVYDATTFPIEFCFACGGCICTCP